MLLQITIDIQKEIIKYLKITEIGHFAQTCFHFLFICQPIKKSLFLLRFIFAILDCPGIIFTTNITFDQISIFENLINVDQYIFHDEITNVYSELPKSEASNKIIALLNSTKQIKLSITRDPYKLDNNPMIYFKSVILPLIDLKGVKIEKNFNQVNILITVPCFLSN